MSINLKFPNNIDPSSFYQEIDNLVSKSGLTYVDAVVYYCERNSLEIETAAALIKGNFRLKSHLQNDGENLNILEKKSKLPI